MYKKCGGASLGWADASELNIKILQIRLQIMVFYGMKIGTRPCHGLLDVSAIHIGGSLN